MKTILFATDYSQNSVAALKYAHKMSTQLGSHLIVTHVFDYPTVLGTKVEEPFPHLEEDAFKEHHTKLQEFCVTHLGVGLDEVNIQLEAIEHKSVINGIIDKTKDSNASLLVVGMKGGSTLREFLMGNTTKQLINKAPCPVLSIPADTSFNKIGTIVYATYFEEEDIRIIKNLIEIAKPFNAEIKTVHVSSEKEYAGKQRKEWFVEKLKNEINYPRVNFEVLFSEDTFETLRIYLGDVGADIVAMVERQQRSLLKNIFHHDLVKKMESYGKIPLIAFHESNYQ